MSHLKTEILLADESESIEFAKRVAGALDQVEGFKSGLIFYLKGDLGAGKSFFSRALIQHFLPEQKVKSPTFTIVESYKCSLNTIHHLDLYRLCDPEELEYLAIRDLFKQDFVALVEWPQKGTPVLPSADATFEFIYLEQGRKVLVEAASTKGEALVKKIML